MATALGYDDRDTLYGGLRDHHLRIGDTQYYVPPTAISVTRRMKNSKTNVLRGRGSMVKSNGYSDRIIEITLFFPDMVSINNELRPLLAQVRKCPFLPIENTLLNNIYKIDAITVAGVSVQSVTGFPHALTAQLQLFAFNPFVYIMDDTERTYDEMFNWPLFRWHYQQNLRKNKDDPNRSLIYYEPLQVELHNDYIFKIASEEDLAFLRKWKTSRLRFIDNYQSDMENNDAFTDDDYTHIAGIPIPKKFGESVVYEEDGTPVWSGTYSDEKDEKVFNDAIDKMYQDDPGRVVSEMDISMDNWDTPGLLLQEVSAGYENVITPVQVQSHESPTHQYMGSQDSIFVLRFFAEDEEALGSLEALVQRSTYLNREYHREVSNGFLQLDHPVTRLFGATYMIVEDMVSSTIEGQPGAYNITLTLSSYNRAQKRLAETKKLSEGVDWKIGWAEKAWWNITDKPWLREDPLGGFVSLDVRKKALYDLRVKEMFKSVEVYPDLELPTYEEVKAAGFEIKNLNNGVYVDPDFFLIYGDPIDFGEQTKQFLENNSTTELRDYMGGKAKASGGSITPDEVSAGEINKMKQILKQSQAAAPAPDSRSPENLPAADMEMMIRKKAEECKIDQRVALAFAKFFDPKLRQFYEAGAVGNKNLGNIIVTDKNVPIMTSAELKYFKDVSKLRYASGIGVMRVSPLMGEVNGLGYNIEYNVGQGCIGLKYYLDQMTPSRINDNVYKTFGIVDADKAVWVGAIACYLGFEREYNLLVKDNKKMPASTTAMIKKILESADTLEIDAEVDKKYSQLPVADYKVASMASAEPTFEEELLDESDFEDTNVTLREMYHDMMKYDRRGRLVRAFPTFFLTFIDEGQFLGAVKMADHFFGYRAVTDITYTNSRKLASSTLIMEMANVFGSLDDAMKANDLTHTSSSDLIKSMFSPGSMANEIENSRSRNANWYKSMYLRTGARVHFRMGYGSNPMNMPTTMNGTITQLQNNGETITVICQDDGIELTNKLKAKPDEQSRGFLFSKQEPTEIVDELLTDNKGALKNWYANRMSNSAYAEHSLGIMHFGMPGEPVNYFWRNEFQDRPKNEITMNIYETTGKLHTEANGFWSKLSDFFGIGSGDEAGININLYDKSVWDVLNITASVGEDYITAVHPFDFRNTIFLGKPHFPIGYEYVLTGSDAEESSRWLFGAGGEVNPFGLREDDTGFAGFAIRKKPFRQIHVYDSWTSIIDNGIITTDQNMYTVAQGVYYDEGRMDTTELIYVDTNIWPEKQRSVQIDTQLNLQGVRLIENIPLIGHWLNKPFKWMFDEYTAIRIAAAGLRDLVKEMYDGYLTVMGDPSAKPYNQVYLYDTYTDMSGPMEIREVTQIMNFEVGFITMIKPDCCVVNSDKRAISFWTTAASVATNLFVVSLTRNMMRNSSYAGTMPIINAVWASVKRRFNAMQGRWDSSKMKGKVVNMLGKDGATSYQGGKGPIYEVDPVSGNVREYNPVSVETKKRWIKSGLLRDLAAKMEGFTVTQSQKLFDSLSSALSYRESLGYDKIDLSKLVKLKTAASEMMFEGAKKAGKVGRWGRRGIQGAIGGVAAAMGPVGWIGFAVEFAITEVITAGIAEWIERFLFTRQACILAPLRKDGLEFSAGINGHQGSVIGDSPDTWQSILTGPVGSVLLGLLGADTAKYAAVDAESADELYGPRALAVGDTAPSTVNMNVFASNFFEAHRKQVTYDANLVKRYAEDRYEAAARMEGRMRAKEKEQARQAEYPDEQSSLVTGDDMREMFGPPNPFIADGTSFETMDLNKPSGISAEAINQAFAGKGKLAGLGTAFVAMESSIPPAPSPLDVSLDQPGAGSRVLNALYLAAHAAWETGWGDSRIFKDKNNMFGYGAYDSDPYNSAYTFSSPQDCIQYAANKVKDNYLTQGGRFYNGPTLVGMNVRYATDKNWHKGIAAIMAKIAQYDKNFVSPSASAASTAGEVPVVIGSEGKRKYHLASTNEAAKTCVDISKQPLMNIKLTLVTPSVYIRKSSYDLLEILGRAYKARTGQTIAITSAYRPGDQNWHGTGYGVDIDTPNAGYIGGRCRLAKGSKEKENLKILMELAVQVGFGGIIHGDVDIVGEVKAAHPGVVITQQNDHYNHLHLSYPR